MQVAGACRYSCKYNNSLAVVAGRQRCPTVGLYKSTADTQWHTHLLAGQRCARDVHLPQGMHNPSCTLCPST